VHDRRVGTRASVFVISKRSRFPGRSRDLSNSTVDFDGVDDRHQRHQGNVVVFPVVKDISTFRLVVSIRDTSTRGNLERNGLTEVVAASSALVVLWTLVTRFTRIQHTVATQGRDSSKDSIRANDHISKQDDTRNNTKSIHDFFVFVFVFLSLIYLNKNKKKKKKKEKSELF
jgi:hypothetical protein